MIKIALRKDFSGDLAKENTKIFSQFSFKRLIRLTANFFSKEVSALTLTSERW